MNQQLLRRVRPVAVGFARNLPLLQGFFLDRMNRIYRIASAGSRSGFLILFIL
jgi:hypothetical protein